MSITMKLSLMSNTSEAFVRMTGVGFLPGGEKVNLLEVSRESCMVARWLAVAGVEVQVRRAGKSRAEEGVAGCLEAGNVRWMEACPCGALVKGVEGEPDMFIISMLSARFDSNNFVICSSRILIII